VNPDEAEKLLPLTVGHPNNGTHGKPVSKLHLRNPKTGDCLIQNCQRPGYSRSQNREPSAEKYEKYPDLR